MVIFLADEVCMPPVTLSRLSGAQGIYLGNLSVSLDNDLFESLLFKITQHKKDEVLLIAIKYYLNCRYCYLRKKENMMDF